MANSFNITNLKKTYYYMKRNGIMPTLGAALERVQAPYFADYKYQAPAKEELDRQRQVLWEKPLTISIVVPAYETKELFLGTLVHSLLEQTYPYWELILADASASVQVQKQWETYKDDRIRYVKLKENAGISENTNQGILEAVGEYIGLLDHDDYLTPDALYEVAMSLKEGKEKGIEYGLVYSDEDKCDETGNHFYDPHVKTDFNLDLFLTNNYICHFCVMKAELMKTLQFRKEYDGAQDYDLCLRALGELWKKHTKVEECICHIPKVLYHWRCHNESTAANPQSKYYAYDAGRRALQDFVTKQGWKATVEEMPHVGFYKVIYEGGIFAQRKDIAAVGYKKIRKGRVVSGIYDKQGNHLYKDLPFCYSGYIHRAVLAQNAVYMDGKNWNLNPKLEEEVNNLLQSFSQKNNYSEAKKQKKLCEYLLQQGYRLYWDPSKRKEESCGGRTP